MIIVSQTKRMIFNFENILGLGISSLEDKSVAIKMYESNDKVGTTIARYETEKRAQEVLKQIIGKYQEYATLQNQAKDIRQISILPKIFEMPKE